MKKYIKTKRNVINTIFYLLLLAILPGSGCGDIKDYTFLNLVPQTTLDNLNTRNVNEILELVKLALKKQTKDLNVEEAILTKAYYEHKNEIDMVIKCSERILLLASDQNILQSATLQLAQIYLDQANFDKAIKYSKDYQEFYPGTIESKKAAYIDVQAHYFSILQAGKDQQKTQKTLELAKNFLNKYKEQDDYANTIYQIIDTCYNNIFDTELSIINTYLDKYNYYKNFSSLNAANRRLAYIKNKILPYIKDQNKEANLNKIELAMSNALKEFNFEQNGQQKAAKA